MTNNVEELIVLGNGFDLQCGLDTSYWNFFSYTLRNLEEFKQYKDDEKKDPIEYFEKIIGVNAINRFTKFIRDEELLKVNELPKNIWYLIFLLKKNRNEDWCQIENIILEYITKVDLGEKLKEETARLGFSMRITRNIKQAFLKYLEVKDTNEYKLYALIIWNLINRNNSPYKELESYVNGDIILKNGAEYFNNILLKELQRLEQDFIHFIENETFDFMNYGNKALDLLGKILGKDIRVDEEIKYNLLTFNYTYTFFLAKSTPNLANSVHGRVATVFDRGSNEIIFGIDHKDIEPDSLAYRFTKNYRTLKLYSTNPEYEDFQNVYSDTIKKIKFYGHSLAEADYSYFQQMFDYYDLYSNNDLQLIFYYSVYDEKKKEEIRQSQFNSISKLISTYGATLDNKDKGNNLLTRLMQTGRLKLKQI